MTSKLSFSFPFKNTGTWGRVVAQLVEYLSRLLETWGLIFSILQRSMVVHVQPLSKWR